MTSKNKKSSIQVNSFSLKFLFLIALLVVSLIPINAYPNYEKDNCSFGCPIEKVKNFFFEIGKGTDSSYEPVFKFGANPSLSSTWQPISTSGTYQTPLTAQTLEILSSDSYDNITGIGARQVTIIGLDSNWNEITEVVNMSGTSPVVLSNNFTRVYRMFVSASGTYANSSAGSHTGTITLRGQGGGVTWATIDLVNGFPFGQTLIAVYTIPAGKTGYLLNKQITLESTKPVDIALFQRQNIDNVTAPYGTMRILKYYIGQEGEIVVDDEVPIKIPEKTDIGFMGRVSTSGTASISFEIVLEDN